MLKKMAVIGGVITLAAAIPSAAQAQALQKQEVPAATTKAVGNQLVGAFTTEGPFNPTAPDHLWFDSRDGTWLFLHFDKPLEHHVSPGTDMKFMPTNPPKCGKQS
jgi:hypothetical protein